MREPELSRDDERLLEAAVRRRNAPDYQAVDEEKLAQDRSLVSFTVKLPAADIYGLKAEARKQDLTAGELLRRFLREGLAAAASRDLDDPDGRAAFLQVLSDELDALRRWTLRSPRPARRPAARRRRPGTGD